MISSSFPSFGRSCKRIKQESRQERGVGNQSRWFRSDPLISVLPLKSSTDTKKTGRELKMNEKNVELDSNSERSGAQQSSTSQAETPTSESGEKVVKNFSSSPSSQDELPDD